VRSPASGRRRGFLRESLAGGRPNDVAACLARFTDSVRGGLRQKSVEPIFGMRRASLLPRLADRMDPFLDHHCHSQFCETLIVYRV
jgi:hypothetical protein